MSITSQAPFPAFATKTFLTPSVHIGVPAAYFQHLETPLIYPKRLNLIKFEHTLRWRCSKELETNPKFRVEYIFCLFCSRLDAFGLSRCLSLHNDVQVAKEFLVGLSLEKGWADRVHKYLVLYHMITLSDKALTIMLFKSHVSPSLYNKQHFFPSLPSPLLLPTISSPTSTPQTAYAPCLTPGSYF